MQIEYKDFDLDLSINSGQCFEWQKIGESLYGEIKSGSILKVKQVGDSKSGYLECEVFGKNLSEEDIRKYFSLDKDYNEVVNSFKKDKHIEKAISYLHGLRNLNQDPWRCLNSFIISANNSVPNITRSVKKICENYGQTVKTDIHEFKTFPSHKTFKNISEQELRNLKLGFRSKYLAKVPHLIEDDNEFFDRLRKLSYKEAKQELVNLPGIGTKVADCILLYSLGKYEAYPVDVWLRRATLETYFPNNEKISDEKLRDWAFEYFGPNAGIAHMFLFVYRRSVGMINHDI